MNFSNKAKVGVLTLVAIIALGVVITWKSDILLRSEGYRLVGVFENIEGLNVGSEVRYRGLKVGKVLKIDPGPKDIRVDAVIDKSIKFPLNSYLRVAFDGLVGLKYLEIYPGKSDILYTAGNTLAGVKTSGIVDFVDIGAKNLVETRRILEVIRTIVENPRIQNAFVDAVLTTELITKKIDKLTDELRRVTAGINAIVANKEFQEDFKGTLSETHRTLASANEFFSSTAQLGLRPSGNIYIGNRANTVRANLDIIHSPGNYLGLGLGEGPARELSLLDLELVRQINSKWGMRIGMINQKLGGGIDYFATPVWVLSGDIYNLNNKPNPPNLRLTSALEISNYLDWVLQGDDILNSTSNYSIGFTVKAPRKE